MGHQKDLFKGKSWGTKILVFVIFRVSPKPNMPKVRSYGGKFWAGYEPGRSALWAGPGSFEWAVYAVILGFSAISQPFVKIEA